MCRCSIPQLLYRLEFLLQSVDISKNYGKQQNFFFLKNNKTVFFLNTVYLTLKL